MVDAALVGGDVDDEVVDVAVGGGGDVGAVEFEEDGAGEPPWVWWRLGLLVSNPGGVGLLGSVERCFELCWRHVAAVAVEAVLVEPVHP